MRCSLVDLSEVTLVYRWIEIGIDGFAGLRVVDCALRFEVGAGWCR